MAKRGRRPSKFSRMGPRNKMSPAMIIVFLVAASFVTVGLWTRWHAFESGADIQEMNITLLRLTQENKHLQIQVAEMTDQQRLEKKAKEYGMVNPAGWQIREVD